MKGRRGQMVELLRQRGELSVAELSEELDIAAPALRRHLEILASEGTVEYRAVKQATGRPYFAYRLTEQAHEAAATGYPRLLERLIHEAAAMPDGSGRVLLESLLERMSDHLAEDYRSRVRGKTVAERARSLTEALRGEGILEDWEQREDGIHLFNSTCPHRRAAVAAEGSLCASERRAIALLLGEEVDQVSRMVDRNGCCEYVIRPRQEPELVTIQ